MTARAISRVLAPDLPATPTASPFAMSKDIPSMARRVVRRLTNSTWRLRTDRTGSVMVSGTWGWQLFSSEFRIERVPNPVPEQIDGKDQCRQRKSGESHDPPLPRKQVIVADPDQGAERGHGVGHAGSEKR